MADDSDLDLQAALQVASQAPSSHNCQPWGVAVADDEPYRHKVLHALATGDLSCGGRIVVVALDRGRELLSLPAHRVEMGLSCGAFLGLLRAALHTRGVGTEVVWTLPGSTPVAVDRLPGSWPAQWLPLAVLSLNETQATPGTEIDWDDLSSLAARRRTHRAPFAGDAIVAGTLDRCLSSEALVPGGGAEAAGVQLWWSDDPEKNAALGKLVGRHGRLELGYGPAWRETLSFIRFSNAEIAAADDGFAISQLLGPRSLLPWWLARLLLSPALVTALKPLGYHRAVGRQLGELVATSPALVALSWPSPDETSWSAQLRGGTAMLDLWLRATRAGLALHPVSVILQHDHARRDLEREIGSPGRVFLFARVGLPAVEYQPTPRRLPETFVVHLTG